MQIQKASAGRFVTIFQIQTQIQKAVTITNTNTDS